MSKQKRFQELFISLLAEKCSEYAKGFQMRCYPDPFLSGLSKEAFTQLEKESQPEEEEKQECPLKGRMGQCPKDDDCWHHGVQPPEKEEWRPEDYICTFHNSTVVTHGDRMPECVFVAVERCECNSNVHTCNKFTAKRPPPEKEEPLLASLVLRERLRDWVNTWKVKYGVADPNGHHGVGCIVDVDDLMRQIDLDSLHPRIRRRSS